MIEPASRVSLPSLLTHGRMLAAGLSLDHSPGCRRQRTQVIMSAPRLVESCASSQPACARPLSPPPPHTSVRRSQGFPLLDLTQAALDCVFSCLDLGGRRNLRLAGRLSRAAVDCRVTKVDLDASHLTRIEVMRALDDLLISPWRSIRAFEVGYWEAPEGDTDCGISAEGCCALAAAGYDLEDLSLGSCGLDDAAAAGLARLWPRLETLVLCSNPRLGAEGVAALATASWPFLSKLDLGGTFQGVCPGLADFSFARLRDLDVSRNTMDPVAAAALSNSSLPSLEVLHVGSAALGNDGAAALAKGRWPRLRLLGLTFSSVGDRGAAALATASWAALQALYLTGNSIGDAGVEGLTTDWPQLTGMHLGRNLVGAAGAGAIARAPWPLLKDLSLDTNKLGNDGAAALGAAAVRFSKLTHVSLGDNNIGNDGAAALARGAWPSLRSLRLARNAIQGRGMAALARGQWPSLTELNVSNQSYP